MCEITRQIPEPPQEMKEKIWRMCRANNEQTNGGRFDLRAKVVEIGEEYGFTEAELIAINLIRPQTAIEQQRKVAHSRPTARY